MDAQTKISIFSNPFLNQSVVIPSCLFGLNKRLLGLFQLNCPVIAEGLSFSFCSFQFARLFY